MAPGAAVLDGFECIETTVDAITNGVGEVLIEEQEFENAIGADVSRVDLAVGLESCAATQQANLFQA